MKVFFLILNLLLCFKVEAQQYFNKRFDFQNSSLEVAQSLISDSNFTWITFISTDTIGSAGWLKFGVMKIDLQGNMIDQKFYGKPFTYFYTGGSASLNKTNDGNFICAASFADTMNTDVLLYKLNRNCDTIWIKIFGDTAYQSGFVALQTSDGGFALCGQDATTGSFGASQMLLIKTDSLGNLQWQKWYGDSSTADLAYAFTITADGGFALAGEKKYLNGTADIYIVKTDSLGNKEWEKVIGDIYGDRLFNIISSSDGNIVVAGQLGAYLSHFWPYIAKFDLLGNLIWEKHYGDSMNQTWLYSIRELSDGSYIAVGDAGTPSTATSGLMIKVASNGDSIWYNRYYSNNPPFQSTDCYLRDIYPTSDGGFVACGIVNPVPPDTGNQDVWILKIDSNGCEIANCIVGVNDVLSKNTEFKVFPNPFNDNINIETRFEKDFDIALYNIYGQKVFSQYVSGDEINLKLSSLPSGIYLLNISSEGKNLYSEKIIHHLN